MNKHLNIAVTGLNATDNPGPGIPIIRSLKQSSHFSCKIIGLSYDTLEPGIYMGDIIDCCYQIPYPYLGENALLTRLEEINGKEHIDVIIPCLDAEIKSFIIIEGKLKKMGINMCLPTLLQFESRQKFNLPQLCKQLGILTPPTTTISNYTEYVNAEKNYPLLVKGKYYEAFLCSNADYAYSCFLKIANKWGYPVLLQDYIEGTEFNVIGCGDGTGSIISNLVMRKLTITEKGKAWTGTTIMNREMQELAHTFCEKTKWKGGFELELIKTDQNDIYLIEINPRIPAWVYLATEAGQNIPEQTVLMALGEQASANNHYSIGKIFIRHSWDLVIDQKDYSNFTFLKERK